MTHLINMELNKTFNFAVSLIITNQYWKISYLRKYWLLQDKLIFQEDELISSTFKFSSWKKKEFLKINSFLTLKSCHLRLLIRTWIFIEKAIKKTQCCLFKTCYANFLLTTHFVRIKNRKTNLIVWKNIWVWKKKKMMKKKTLKPTSFFINLKVKLNSPFQFKPEGFIKGWRGGGR